MEQNNNQQAFLALVRAGLWETDACLSPYGDIDFQEIYRLSQEQSVVGLVAAGLEHIKDFKVPQEYALSIAGDALQIEHKNKAMNDALEGLINKMRCADIYALLLKGQGVAQCYERSLWRTCGDIDLFLNDENYKTAKKVLLPLASFVEEEGTAAKHLGMIINVFNVELHGTLNSGLSIRVDRNLRDIKNAVFYDGKVRSWMNGKAQIFLPAVDEDVVYIFTHILSHFYKGGIGLRQVCDWSRLLWTYRGSINLGLLESRIRKMGLMSEWRTFGTFAVDYLGMPDEAMPFYSLDNNLKYKAKRICSFILKVGNFGHNREMSFYHKGSYFMQKVKSLGRRCRDLYNHFLIFPFDTIRFIPCILFNGLSSALRGE